MQSLQLAVHRVQMLATDQPLFKPDFSGIFRFDLNIRLKNLF